MIFNKFSPVCLRCSVLRIYFMSVRCNFLFSRCPFTQKIVHVVSKAWQRADFSVVETSRIDKQGWECILTSFPSFSHSGE